MNKLQVQEVPRSKRPTTRLARIDGGLHYALKMYAARHEKSMSEVLNEAIRDLLRRDDQGTSTDKV